MPLLRVRATLATPVALQEPLHLDAILMARRFGSDRERLTRTCAEESIHVAEIPVVHMEHGGVGIWLTSAAEPAPGARRLGEHLTRKRDGDDWDYLVRPVDTRSGALRDVCLRFPLIATPWLEWWAVGNRRGVRKVLQQLRAVGMLRRHGYGEVLSWDVESIAADAASALIVGGVARRNLPEAWCEEPDVVELVPVAPPYWHAATRMPGVKAGRRTGLASGLLQRLARLH